MTRGQWRPGHGLIGTGSEVAVNLTVAVIALSLVIHGLGGCGM